LSPEENRTLIPVESAIMNRSSYAVRVATSPRRSPASSPHELVTTLARPLSMTFCSELNRPSMKFCAGDGGRAVGVDDGHGDAPAGVRRADVVGGRNWPGL
jgi:hypothetical protein